MIGGTKTAGQVTRTLSGGLFNGGSSSSASFSASGNGNFFIIGGRRRWDPCRFSILRLFLWSVVMWIAVIGALVYFANVHDEFVNRLTMGKEFDLDDRRAQKVRPLRPPGPPYRAENIQGGQIVHFVERNRFSAVDEDDPFNEQNPTNLRRSSSNLDGSGFSRWKKPVTPPMLGLGEMGQAVSLPPNESMSSDLRDKVEDGWKQYGYNLVVSDMISVHRSLPDVRSSQCKTPGLYSTNLPDASVVMCFQNEAWSTLLRSIHSVLNRSPPHLLKEIILVDDFSDKVHLKEKLDNYLKTLPKVTVIRQARREGLIRSRLAGARNATGSVLVFLDSHIEATEGWLEPLLYRISQNWSHVVVPIIDSIADKDFRFKGKVNESMHIGDFDWALLFHWQMLSQERRSRLASTIAPVPTPTMAGGLFAIDKNFFEHLGTYDEALDFWGGENMELSFKTWLCGGSLETIPCSRVGHIFRTRTPLRWPYKGKNAIMRNVVRVARVWLDEYITLFYAQAGEEKREWNIGDLTPRLALKQRLNCKPFKWYLDNVFPEKFAPRDALARGEIRNLRLVDTSDGSYNYCLDAPGARNIRKGDNKKLSMYPCHESGGNQNWHFLKSGQIRKEAGGCLWANVSSVRERKVFLRACDTLDSKQQWVYDAQRFYLHPRQNLQFCLGVKDRNMEILIEPCRYNDDRQLWKMERYLNATF